MVLLDGMGSFFGPLLVRLVRLKRKSFKAKIDLIPGTNGHGHINNLLSYQKEYFLTIKIKITERKCPALATK